MLPKLDESDLSYKGAIDALESELNDDILDMDREAIDLLGALSTYLISAEFGLTAMVGLELS